jgi:hypothetical protein
MRGRFSSFLAAAVAMLVAAGSAHAGTLTAATWTQTIQGVDLTITNSAATCTDVPGSNHTQQVITCPGFGLGATGTATSSNYSASLTLGLFAIDQFTTGGVVLVPVHTTAVLGSGVIGISGNHSSAAASMFVNGQVTVKFAAHVAKGASASMLTPAMTTVVKVPLSVGKVGTFLAYTKPLATYSLITVDFYGWTPHTLTLTGLTTKFAPLPDVVAMGSFALTPMGGGTVTLVSPSKISIDGSLSQRRTLLSLTTLKLTYAPEPSILLMLAAGAAGLVWVGSRKGK